MIYTIFVSYGKLGVVIFVMISGYFSCKSKFNLKRLLLLIAEVVFYSLAWYAISLYRGDVAYSAAELFKRVFVVFFSRYWFFTCYLALSLVSPVINLAIKGMDRKMHLIVCIVGGVIYALVASFSSGYMYRNDLITFIYLYIVAAYLRLYGGKLDIIYDIIGLIFSVGAGWIIYFLNEKITWEYEFNPFANQSATNLFIAIFLILICKKAKPHHNKFVNYIAASSFGVYLIHDNEFRRTIWWKLFKNFEYAMKTPQEFIAHMFMAVAIVFVAGTIIDVIRREVLERPLSMLYDLIKNKPSRKPKNSSETLYETPDFKPAVTAEKLTKKR